MAEDEGQPVMLSRQAWLLMPRSTDIFSERAWRAGMDACHVDADQRNDDNGHQGRHLTRASPYPPVRG